MTTALEKLLLLPPFGVDPEEKSFIFREALADALRHHQIACPPYSRFLTRCGFDTSAPLADIADVPYLPSAIFKRMNLRSGLSGEVVREIRSSGTSSQTTSRIALDNITRQRQMKVLSAIMADLIGGLRRPFIILDVEPKNENTGVELSARIAGMRGFLLASSQSVYVLKDEGGVPVLDIQLFTKTVEKFAAAGQPFCLLGYTYIFYEYVIRALRNAGCSVDLPKSTFVLHFGGWKKLQNRSVTPSVLAAHARGALHATPMMLRNIYGFTEQLSIIYPDDQNGVKRVPTYAELIVRDVRTLEPVPDGEVGFLEFLTPLPNSYPGNAVLLDDMGRIVTREPDPKGREGVGFEIVGRAEGAEPRGCGDTLADVVYEVRV